ncbi:DUF3800 domain-containing protein [Francisella tularensis]|uniref:DUF3800 domain-containing protein n=1 Tax=Francisella tularensis TaxID=263 RepID=UPI001C0E9C29|nr:DUF3800 domain-containing protein [Francisella tularensis]MBK2109077.1 DUF3800 domain-containing protein [Francisella tularensis subsp. novicida FSC595]
MVSKTNEQALDLKELPVYKFFCDESCHLEHDGADIMVLGALHCSAERAEQLNRHIKWLRHQHNYKPELKWSKLNKHQWQLYKDIIDLIIDSEDVFFKSTIVMNKKQLDHNKYNAGSHNTFYYKMFYYTLRDYINTNNDNRIYLDYMDTLGSEKTQKLCEIFRNSSNRSGLKISTTIVQSYAAQLIQVCDLFIGAIGYKNRTDIENQSEIKTRFVDYLEQKLKRPLNITTSPWENKFNIFKFSGRD